MAWRLRARFLLLAQSCVCVCVCMVINVHETADWKSTFVHEPLAAAETAHRLIAEPWSSSPSLHDRIRQAADAVVRANTRTHTRGTHTHTNAPEAHTDTHTHMHTDTHALGQSRPHGNADAHPHSHVEAASQRVANPGVGGASVSEKVIDNRKNSSHWHVAADEVFREMLGAAVTEAVGQTEMWDRLVASQQPSSYQPVSNRTGQNPPQHPCADAPLLLVRYPRSSVGLASALGYVGAALMHAYVRGRILVFDERDAWTHMPAEMCQHADEPGAQETVLREVAAEGENIEWHQQGNASSHGRAPRTQLHCLVRPLGPCTWWNSGRVIDRSSTGVLRDTEAYQWPEVGSKDDDGPRGFVLQSATALSSPDHVRHVESSVVVGEDGSPWGTLRPRSWRVGCTEGKPCRPRILRMTMNNPLVFYRDFLYMMARDARSERRSGLDPVFWQTQFNLAALQPAPPLIQAMEDRLRLGLRRLANRGDSGTPAVPGGFAVVDGSSCSLAPGRFVAWHLRRGDKTAEYAELPSVDAEPVRQAAEALGAQQVFAASDSPRTLLQLRRLPQLANLTVCVLEDLQPLGDTPLGAARLSGTAEDASTTGRLVTDALTNIFVMAQAGAFVGMFHSNIAALAVDIAYAQGRVVLPVTWTDAASCDANHQQHGHYTSARHAYFSQAPFYLSSRHARLWHDLPMGVPRGSEVV